MKRVLLIEPHPDDICLGFLYSIKREKADYHLISVSSHNGRDSKSFCEEVGIEWHQTKLVEDILYPDNRISPREIKKQENSFSYQRMYYLEHHGTEYLKIEKLISKAVEEIGCDVIITNLGILHPIHVLASIACQEIAREQKKELIYFADFPYAFRKFGEKIIEDSEMRYSLVESGSSRKDKIFEKHYPTETSLLRWDREGVTHRPEMIFLAREEKNIPIEKETKETKIKPVKKEIKVSIFSRGGSYTTGAHRHADYLKMALEKVGMTADLVDFDSIDNPDVLLFESMGVTFEEELKKDKHSERLEKFAKNYMGKIPFVLIRHSVADRNVFKNSFAFFKDFVWDLVIPVSGAESMVSLVKEDSKAKEVAYIDHPFVFEDKWFADRTEHGNTIVSPSRIASCKRTNIILDIAEILFTERKFLIAGREDGVYWYRQIKEHPNRMCVTFVGEYENPLSIYERSAFAIDLQYLNRNSRIQGCKQFTLLESIGCGNIPIIFDNYRYENGFEAIWLPLPERKGRTIIFDVEKYVEIIRESKYDFETAVRNRELLKKEHDLEKIGNQYKEEFRRLLR